MDFSIGFPPILPDVRGFSISARQPELNRISWNAKMRRAWSRSGGVVKPDVCVDQDWVVVEPTHLKNMGQNRNLPQVGVKIKNIWNHHLENLAVEKTYQHGFLNRFTFTKLSSNIMLVSSWYNWDDRKVSTLSGTKNIYQISKLFVKDIDHIGGIFPKSCSLLLFCATNTI